MMNAVLDKWRQAIEIAHDPTWLGPQSKARRRDMCIRDLADEIERLEAENIALRSTNILRREAENAALRSSIALGRAVMEMDEGARLARSGENKWEVSGFGIYYYGTTPEEALTKAKEQTA